jgi:hypothetical protein
LEIGELMARRTTKLVAEPVPEPTPVIDTPIRRRRRRTTIDTETQSSRLVSALLATRGARGASQTELRNIIQWARSVNAEAEHFKTVSGRQRRIRQQGTADRLAAFQLDKALLDGVLDGKIGIDIDDSGQIIFLNVEGAE